MVAALAFEIQHRVHHVLEHARAGDQPFLGDVADQHQHEAAAFRQPDQLLCGAAHLAHRARGAVERVEIHRLDRVDHDEIGSAGGIERSDDVAHAAGRGEPHRPVGDTEPLGAQPHLIDRLLAGDVGSGAARAGECGGDLQQEGRFADPGVAADQDRRAGYETTAAHPVDLADPGFAARRAVGGAAQADEVERTAAARGAALAQSLRRRGPRHLLGEAVPGAASLAAPGPFRIDRATLLAGEAGLGLGHQSPDFMRRALPSRSVPRRGRGRTGRHRGCRCGRYPPSAPAR
jgi:hypothetical protein